MGGFNAGWYWRAPVSDGLHGLTIPVMELLAAGVNLIVLFTLLGSPSSGSPQFWIKWEVDALAAHFVLKNDSSRTELMVLVHHLIIASDAFKYFRPALLLCHTAHGNLISGWTSPDRLCFDQFRFPIRIPTLSLVVRTFD